VGARMTYCEKTSRWRPAYRTLALMPSEKMVEAAPPSGRELRPGLDRLCSGATSLQGGFALAGADVAMRVRVRRTSLRSWRIGNIMVHVRRATARPGLLRQVHVHGVRCSKGPRKHPDP